MKKEPWETELEKHDGDDFKRLRVCNHDWGEPFDGRIKCRKCGSYQDETNDS